MYQVTIYFTSGNSAETTADSITPFERLIAGHNYQRALTLNTPSGEMIILNRENITHIRVKEKEKDPWAK